MRASSRKKEWLNGRVRWLEEQLKVLAKNHFDSKHESASEEVIGQRALLFDEAEVYAHLEELEKEQRETPERKPYEKKNRSASEEVIGQRALLFDEAEVYAHLEELEKEQRETPERKPSEKKNRVFMLDKLPENCEVNVVPHELSEEERVCPVCGSVMEPVGKEVVRTLEIIPAKFVVREDRYVNYACQN